MLQTLQSKVKFTLQHVLLPKS